MRGAWTNRCSRSKGIETSKLGEEDLSYYFHLQCKLVEETLRLQNVIRNLQDQLRDERQKNKLLRRKCNSKPNPSEHNTAGIGVTIARNVEVDEIERSNCHENDEGAHRAQYVCTDDEPSSAILEDGNSSKDLTDEDNKESDIITSDYMAANDNIDMVNAESIPA